MTSLIHFYTNETKARKPQLYGLEFQRLGECFGGLRTRQGCLQWGKLPTYMQETTEDVSNQSSVSDVWVSVSREILLTHSELKYNSISPLQPELTSCPHKLILKKWKYFVPLEVKLGPFINEPTLLRLLKSQCKL